MNTVGLRPETDFFKLRDPQAGAFSEYALLGCLIAAAYRLQPWSWMKGQSSALLRFHIIQFWMRICSGFPPVAAANCGIC